MEGLWERLIEILEQESALYRDIFELSRHKTGIIVEGKVTELEKLTGAEQKMLLGVGKLEQQREETVDRLARHIGVPTDQLNISLTIRKAGEDLGKKFANLKEEISGTLKELKEVNDLNSQLIEKSLEYIDFSINLIAGDPQDVTYSHKRDGDKEKGGSFFDQKV